VKVWLERTLNGCRASDEASSNVLRKFPLGTSFEAEVITRRIRSSAWNRRYWLLMNLLSEHVERVELEEGWMWEIKNDPDRAHTAMKYITGLYDSFALDQGVIVRMLKSVAFDKMSPEEWADYWPKALDAVHQKFLRHVELSEIEDEIARLAS